MNRNPPYAAILALALRAGVLPAVQDLKPDDIPRGFVPLPGGVPPAVLPAHVAQALEGVPAAPGYVLCTNVVALSARYHQPPLPGRAARVEACYSNLTEGAYHLRGPDDAEALSGVRYFALRADGSRTLLRDEAWGVTTYQPRLGPGAAWRVPLRLSPDLVAACAGSEGLVVAFAGRMESGWCLYAESAPLPVLPEPWEGDPPPLTQAQWHSVVTNWVQTGLPPRPYELLKDFPDAAPFFPGTFLDATLPEAFRLEFARYMPGVDAYDPGVLAFIQDAPDKDAPLVIAALNVLRRSRGGTPEEGAARDAASAALYAMSQDPQHPLLFRLHAAAIFRPRSPVFEFPLRDEPHFKLLAADEIRGHRGGSYYEEDRVLLRAGLTALLSDNTPLVAGPMAGKYPENATVGQVAAIILADLEAKWAAEPARVD